MAVMQRSRGWASGLVRHVSGPTLTFDLPAETAALRLEPEWKVSGHGARTLAKYPDTRIVLEAMRGGTSFSPNGPSERLTVHCLSGHLRIRHPDQRATDLHAGGLCALDRFMVDKVEAVTDCACLVTVSWPPPA